MRLVFDDKFETESFFFGKNLDRSAFRGMEYWKLSAIENEFSIIRDFFGTILPEPWLLSPKSERMILCTSIPAAPI